MLACRRVHAAPAGRPPRSPNTGAKSAVHHRGSTQHGRAGGREEAGRAQRRPDRELPPRRHGGMGPGPQGARGRRVGMPRPGSPSHLQFLYPAPRIPPGLIAVPSCPSTTRTWPLTWSTPASRGMARRVPGPWSRATPPSARPTAACAPSTVSQVRRAAVPGCRVARRPPPACYAEAPPPSRDR